MRDLAAVVEELRTVRVASRRFLQLHAVERTVIEPALDRVAADIEGVELSSSSLDDDDDDGPGPRASREESGG